MNLDLTGKQALVCGSTQGIGKAIAIELASLGADVTLLARNKEKLDFVKSLLDTNKGQEHHYLVADFSEPEKMHDIVREYLFMRKKVHILINNTGGPAAGSVLESRVDDFVKAFMNHLICSQYLVQACVPLMRNHQYGRIINIISTSVKVPIDGLGVSNTIRGAVANWAKTLANEVAGFGITVNNILPGFTKTERLNELFRNRAAKLGISQEAYQNEMLKTIPAQRFAEASEIAAVAAFLASPSASYITGINLPIDGGRTPCL